MVPMLAPALPEILIACAAMALLMVGVFRKSDTTVFATWVSAIVLAIAGYMSAGVTTEVVTFADGFIVNGFTGFAKVLTYAAAIVAMVLALPWLKREGVVRFEIPILMLLATLGMSMMISANDLLSLYVGLELQSLSLYVLAASHRESERATEAGLKYFVLGAVASGLLLYGMSLVYGFGGTTTFDGIAAAVSSGASTGLIVGLVFMLAGLAFKVSAVPFHMWTPDVYEGAPTPITAFFSVAPKIAALCLFLRVLVGPFGEIPSDWQQVIILISVLSMGLGAFAAIAQSNIKRLMAYSSIGHVGYALIGLAAASPEGARGLLYYLLIYMVMNLGVWAVILSMRVQGRYVETLDDLKGISKTNPGIALVMVILMFSMAGVPPTAGFLAKYFVFMSAVNAGLIALAVIGVLASAVGAFYYLRIIKIMYFDEPVDGFEPPDFATGSVMAASGVLVLVLFFVSGPLIASADGAAQTLFGG